MRLLLLVSLLGLALLACKQPAEPQAVSAPTSDEALVMVQQPLVRIYREPGCADTSPWLARLTGAGFPTELVDAPDLPLLKEQLGLPFGLEACHTAEVEGYVLEGHVPLREISRLLRERPEVVGLLVPGASAPSGSYIVWLVHKDGTQTVYAQYDASLAQVNGA